MVENSLLIHELQLGNKLSKCINTHRRADFSLLLSMLCSDATEFSEFTLPKTQTVESNTTEELLRRTYDLPNKLPLALESMSEINQFNQAKYVEENRFADIQLINTLNPKPIAFRDNSKHIASQVMTNTSLYCQQKMKEEKQESNSSLNRAQFNAKEWLKSVQQTIVESTLITA